MAELERTLSFPAILIITVNSIMGTGIFFLPAIGAGISGSASIIAWLLMSLVAILFGFIFAELVSMFPKSGGIYEYAKQAFGPFPSFILGWLTLVAGNITIAMLIVGAIRYLNPSLDNTLKVVISIAFVLAFNAMAYKGMKTSAVMLITFGCVTVGTLLSLIIPGVFQFSRDNIIPLNPDIGLVLLTTFFIAETFFGWETATFLAEETKDPTKVMPRALVIGTILVALISLVFVIVSLGNIPSETFSGAAAPLALLGATYYGNAAIDPISIFVYLSIIGSVAGWIVSAPRLVMSLAQDRLFITQLAAVHPKYKTPHKAIIFQSIVTSFLIVVGSASYELLLELLVPMVLLMYAGVVCAFLALRMKFPKAERPFRIKGGFIIGILLLIAVGGLIGTWIATGHNALPIATLGISFVLIGIPIYLLLNAYYNPAATIKLTEFFAYFTLLLENFLLPRRVRQEILTIFHHLEEKHILEYGAGVGTLTLHLAEKVGPKGRITATDISERNLRILNRRLQKKGILHVATLHDPHQVNRLHPTVAGVDFVYSVGMLSYIQDLQKVLKEFAKAMPESGKICFVEYVDFFRILPNPEWLDDPVALKEIFSEAGFGVQVIKIRGLFWNYLFIYGELNPRGTKLPYI